MNDAPGNGQSPVTRTAMDLDRVRALPGGEASAVANDPHKLEAAPAGMHTLSVACA